MSEAERDKNQRLVRTKTGGRDGQIAAQRIITIGGSRIFNGCQLKTN